MALVRPPSLFSLLPAAGPAHETANDWKDEAEGTLRYFGARHSLTGRCRWVRRQG